MQQFSPEFRSQFHDLQKWRRDVRHFKPNPMDSDHLQSCLEAFTLDPSVGLSEPWPNVRVKSATERNAELARWIEV
ncbi:MAG: nitroreductase family protein [Rhodobacteraceae bacterium]|nr:nitroreductase family protein [Paracoccaceae bacterium]